MNIWKLQDLWSRPPPTRHQRGRSRSGENHTNNRVADRFTLGNKNLQGDTTSVSERSRGFQLLNYGAVFNGIRASNTPSTEVRVTDTRYVATMKLGFHRIHKFTIAWFNPLLMCLLAWFNPLLLCLLVLQGG